MFFEIIWTMAVLTTINSILLLIVILKMKKQERFQTSEAHTNLELINQSLNRLTSIAEKLENSNSSGRDIRDDRLEREVNNSGQSKEQRARAMIRQGEDPRRISRQLGISKSEIELLIASEKLTSGNYGH